MSAIAQCSRSWTVSHYTPRSSTCPAFAISYGQSQLRETLPSAPEPQKSKMQSMFGPPVQDRSGSHADIHQAVDSATADDPPPIRQGRSSLHAPRSGVAKQCQPSVPAAGLAHTVLHAAPRAQPSPSPIDNPSYVTPCNAQKLQND